MFGRILWQIQGIKTAIKKSLPGMGYRQILDFEDSLNSDLKVGVENG
jgi:hypothetical protein